MRKTRIKKKYLPTVICKNCLHPLEAHLNLDPSNKTCNFNEKKCYPFIGTGRCGCVKPWKKMVKNL